MAAPSATPRVDPAGLLLEDGYRSVITFATDTNLELWEKTVQPPGMDGGDAIDITTMHNDVWRTAASRALVTLTDSTAVCAYDPVCYTSLLALLNVHTTITHTFPDGSTVAYYGFLRSVEFAELVEGTQPEVTITITPTNRDSSGVEYGPTVVSVAGT